MGHSYLSNVKKLYFINLFHSLIPAYVIERLAMITFYPLWPAAISPRGATLAVPESFVNA